MLQHLRPALVMMALFTLLLGLAYPLAITGVAQLALPAQADGSLIRQGDRVIGSSLIGQGFARPEYLHPRPSAAGSGYDPTSSSGSNFGPLDPKLADRIKGDAATLHKETQSPISADAVTASASGLDPDVSPEYADRQVDRIAGARKATADEIRSIIRDHTAGRTLAILGEPRVNVLAVNRALDARFGAPAAAPSPTAH